MERTSCFTYALGTFSVAIWLASGCGKSADTPTAQVQGTPEAAAAQQAGSTPAEAVANFMEAVRTGDTEATSAMLSTIAREKTSAAGLDVAPPGRASMKYEVGEVEYVTEAKDGAHVLCRVTDEGGDGEPPRDDEIIWVLRKEAAGWRIAGMVTKVIPNMPPLVLNYEDPDDMIRKLDMLQQEMEKEMQSAAPPAGQQPGPQAQVPANDGVIRQ